MALVEITGGTGDAGALGDDRPWKLWAAAYQPDGNGGVITTRSDREANMLRPIAGVLSFKAVAGKAVYLENPDKRQWLVTIPEVDTPLWDVIEAAVAYPPETSQEALDAAVVNALPPLVAEELEVQTSTAVATDLAGRNLSVERVADSVQFKLGSLDVGEPLDFELNLPFADPSAAKTSAYTAGANELVPADATSGSFTVTLPEAPPSFTIVVVKKIDSTGNVVTVQRSGADVFNRTGGPSSAQLVTPDQSLWFQYKTGIWYVLGHGMPLAALDDRYIRTEDGGDLFFDRILDLNGEVALDFYTPGSVGAFLQLRTAGVGGAPTIAAAGTNSDVSLFLQTKGSNGQVRLLAGDGSSMLRALAVASAVNYPFVRSSATGAAVAFGASGADTDVSIDLIPRGAGTVRANGVEVATRGMASTGSGATLTPNASTADIWARTAQGQALTINAMTGTLKDGKRYGFRLKDSGTSRTLTWDAFYRAVGATLPTATTASKTLYVFGYYNAADLKLDITDVKLEA